MLWTIFVILLILWLLGIVSGQLLGGYSHILLLIAVVVLVIRLIQGRSVVPSLTRRKLRVTFSSTSTAAHEVDIMNKDPIKGGIDQAVGKAKETKSATPPATRSSPTKAQPSR